MRIVSGSSDNTVRIWDAASGAELLALRGHEGPVRAARFLADSAGIVSGSDDSTIRVWDAASGKELEVGPLSGAMTDFALSPNGAQIVVATMDGSLRVVGDTDLDLIGHESLVQSVAFSPDGGRIVSGSDDSSVRVWFVGKDDAALIAHACELLPRDLSLKEMERFNLKPDRPWPCAERAKTLWPHPVQAAIEPAAGLPKNGESAAPQ
jgi:WD40 repeat protein